MFFYLTLALDGLHGLHSREGTSEGRRKGAAAVTVSCAAHLFGLDSPRSDGLPELDLVGEGHVHLVKQGAEFVVTGFEDGNSCDIVLYNRGRVLVERGFHALDLNHKVGEGDRARKAASEEGETGGNREKQGGGT